MSRIRSADTSLELRVRKYLFKRGYRYRLKYPITGKPDIVFPKIRIVIFINGCFWHFHGCKLSTIPKTRTEFWVKKLTATRERDKLVLKELSREWVVVTLWECELEDKFEETMSKLEEFISGLKVSACANTID